MRAKQDAAADFFDEYPGSVPRLARRLRHLIRSELPGAQEEIDRSSGVVGYGYGPGYKGVICTIILSKAGVKLGIAGGAAMVDPTKLLEGAGKRHRHVAFRLASDFQRSGIRDLLRTALRRYRAREREALKRSRQPTAGRRDA